MSKKKRKSPPPVAPEDFSATPKKPFNWRLLLTLVGNTLIIFAVYRLAIQTTLFPYVLGLYLAAAAVMTVIFVVYNRGFSRRGVTAEMLPDTMSAEEKCEFIADGERRLKKSKWMLTVLFPLLFTFTYDIIELFVLEYFTALLS